MKTKIRTEDLSFLQLADSFFPTGLYSTSNGLEALYYTKKVKSKDIEKLIELFLQQQVGPSDCTALGNAFEYVKKSDLQGLVYTDQTVYSMKTIEEVRIASVRSGTQLLKCVYSFAKKKKMLESYVKLVNAGNASGTYPVALAVSAWSLGVEKYRAGMMLLYGFSVSMIGAALRLGLVQHFEAQKIIHHLKPCILKSLCENVDRPLSAMWQFAPALDVLQMKHEQMVSKMFITWIAIFRVFSKRIPRVGIGGPVGSGKTMLIEKVVPLLYDMGYKAGIISNDVVSKEDAERMRKSLSTEGGSCPKS